MKFKVYVHSFGIPTVGFVDKEGAMHACAQAQKTAFQGLQGIGSLLGSRYLCEEERKVLIQVEEFCRSNDLEYEVIDLGTKGFVERLGLKMKGVKAPAVCYGEKMFRGVPCDEDLKKLGH